MPGSGFDRGNAKAACMFPARRVQRKAVFKRTHRKEFKIGHSTATIERDSLQAGKF
jgi:hypothetical protein